MADGRHFENRYISISQPRMVRIWRNLVRRRKFWPRRQKRDKNAEIRIFKMADGRHIENHFLAITRLHIVQLRWNLEWGGTIARIQRVGYENVKFRTSNMADGRHFENRYISVSQPRIVRNFTKFGLQTQILTQATETWQKFTNSRWWTDAIFKIIFGYNWGPYCPIKMKFGLRSTIACIWKLGHENFKFRKSDMADGCHFKNHYISISQPQIVRS